MNIEYFVDDLKKAKSPELVDRPKIFAMPEAAGSKFNLKRSFYLYSMRKV